MKALLKWFLPETHPLRIAFQRWKNYLIAACYGFPGRNFTVIGITGTDGKTTTVAMTAHILRNAGLKVGAISTAFFEINGERMPNPTQKTTVDALTLQKLLKRMRTEGCTHVVIESSSHGLLQGRIAGMKFDVTAVTNVTMEHLDYHGTMEQYIAAKGLLFRALKPNGTKVLKEDDASFQTFVMIPSEKTIVWSPKKQLKNMKSENGLPCADVVIGNSCQQVKLNVPGMFNLENALCAVSCAEALGIDAATAVRALGTFRGAGGRMERINCGQPFHVFIDFTVTPAAYERTLHSAREIAGKKRVLVLTGSCGDRMREKRPLVGKLCAELADLIVVTNEDPYTEDPERIIDDVLSGIPASVPIYREIEAVPENVESMNKFCVRISDRLKGLNYILKSANEGDVVLLCGKGADVTMMTKNGQIPWNEKQIVEDILRR